MNIRKIGLTALAGSLVASTAFAGELTISGAAKFSYKSMDGTNERVGASTGTTGTGMDTASPFAMDQDISAAGSAELDNGMTISVSHGLTSTGGASDTSSLTLDMGDMGKLSYNDTDVGGGLKALDDLSPSAYEETWDGVNGEVAAQMASGAGFSYSNTIGGASVGIYGPLVHFGATMSSLIRRQSFIHKIPHDIIIGSGVAAAISAGITANDILIGKVITSEYCRAKDTASLALGKKGKNAKSHEDLNFLPFEDYTDEQLDTYHDKVRPMLTKQPKKGNTFIVGHDDPFEGTTGIYPDPQGTAYVIKPNGDSYDIVAQLRPNDWAFGADI